MFKLDVLCGTFAARTGWMLTLTFGRGAGYRGGADFEIGWRVRRITNDPGAKRLVHLRFTRSARNVYVPQGLSWQTRRILTF